MNTIQKLLVLILVWTGASYAQIKWEHITGSPYSIGTTAPVTCTAGDVFFKTNATAGQNIYGCTTGNVWTLVSGAVLSVNGVIGAVTLGIGSDGTAPAWSGGTLNIPSAGTTSVTAGTISKTEYDTFNAKEPAISTGKATQYWRGDKVFASVQLNATTDLTSGQVPAARGGLGADASAYSGFVRMSSGVASASDIVTADLPATIDFGDKTATTPAKKGTLAPATCSIGMTFFDTDATAGENWLLCTSENTWTAVVGGSGSLTTYSVVSFAATFTSETTVVLTHNFNSTRQVISCYDGDSKLIEPNTVTIGGPSSTVVFSAAQTGVCVVIGGTGLYEESFTGQTSVNLDHDFDTTSIIVKCYDGDEAEVQPDTITATDADNATVTFGVAQTGRCVVASTLAASGGSGSGTVTSVTIAAPAEITVTNPTITTSGTATLSFTSQTAGKFLASPSGASGAMSARVIAQADLPVMTGDSGSGGVKGAVPAPAAGDAAAAKFLKADGTWAVPAGTGEGGGGDTTSLLGTATLNSWGTLAAQTCSNKTFTLNGAQLGDTIAPGWPASLSDSLIGRMSVSATDTVKVILCNPTASGIAIADGYAFSARILASL